MKKLTFLAAACTMLFVASCSSDSSTDTTTAAAGEHGHNDGHDHDGMAAADDPELAGKVAVETPKFSSVADPFKKNVSQLVDKYMPVKDALVASDAAAAQKAANELSTSANALPVASLQSPEQKEFAEVQREKVKEKASSIANTSDIASQREQLEELSKAVFALTKAFGATDKRLYYQYCPMAFDNLGGYWLSSNKEIKNPYFGDKMLECGSNEEVLN